LIKKHIPNFVTTLNLFSGCIAIVFAFKGNLVLSSWFIGFAAIFDFMDGMLARVLNAKSPIGIQLDSLADMISFGVAPAMILYQFMRFSHNTPFLYFNEVNALAFAAFLIPVFSALRLAKFNIDENQSSSFIGLPTPANALFFASFPLVMLQAEASNLHVLVSLLSNYWVLLGATLFFSWLMVSSIPLFSLKFKNLNLADNIFRYILIFSALLLFIFLKFFTLPLVVMLYVLLSFVANIRKA
jgi:CDP-diacylglycerol--serine O-phosphatidyltransferase